MYSTPDYTLQQLRFAQRPSVARLQSTTWQQASEDPRTREVSVIQHNPKHKPWDDEDD